MEHNRGSAKSSFAQALQREIDTIESSENKQHRVHSYIKRGMYCSQLKRLWHYFGRKNVFIAKHDDLKEKTQDTVQSICNHLGAKTNHEFDETKQRAGQIQPKKSQKN